jgi:hypothetical protein
METEEKEGERAVKEGRAQVNVIIVLISDNEM